MTDRNILQEETDSFWDSIFAKEDEEDEEIDYDQLLASKYSNLPNTQIFEILYGLS